MATVGGSYYLEKTAGGNIVKMDSKWCDVCDLATKSILPKLTEYQTGENLDTFYTTQKNLASDNLQAILGLLKSIETTPSAMRKHVVPLFLLLGEQSDFQEPWCSKANEDMASQIIKELYRILGMTMTEPGPLSAFFIRDFQSISNPVNTTFSRLLRTFRTSLGVKDAEWHQWPAARRSFQWLLLQAAYPYLDEHLEGCILPSLNFLNDFESDNILFGAQCISHILENVLKSKMKHLGWGLIVLEQYKKCLCFKYTSILDTLMPDIFKLLKMIESDPHDNAEKFTQYDSVLEIFLNVLETSDGLNKSIWLKHMTALLKIMGFATLHWFDRIVRVLLQNTTCVEPQRWLWILKCTDICIINSWIKPDSDTFSEIILRIMFNVTCLGMLLSPDEKEIVDEVQELALECFRSLSHYDDFPGVREELSKLHIVGEGKLMPEFLSAIKDLFGEHEDEDGEDEEESADDAAPGKDVS